MPRICELGGKLPANMVDFRAAQAARAGRCARVGLLTELGVSAPASARAGIHSE